MGRRRRRRGAAGCGSREIPREMLQEILLKLPATDVVRCSRVSSLWRSVASDPDFRDHHAATFVADAELLLVTERRAPGWADKASVFDVSSGKPIRDVAIPRGYTVANICNGFLCFVHGLKASAEAPAVVCNPVTGEELTLPKGPPGRDADSHLFALGFSPSTSEYKMFRFSFRPNSYARAAEVYLDVHTLGTTTGWRQDSYISESRPLLHFPPVFIAGRLYVLNSGSTQSVDRRMADRMMVVDVATERRRMYRLPYPTNQYHWTWDPLVDAFEMKGQLCLAVNIVGGEHRREIQFWVMSPPPDDHDQQLDDDGDKLYWDLRYSFHADDPYFFNKLTSVWLDDGGTLCYRHGDTLYKYDTARHSASPGPMAECLPCDHKLRLPATPPRSLNCKDAQKQSRCQWDESWDIYCGYRPTLLSPLTLSSPPCQDASDEDPHKLEKDVLQLL